MRVVVRRERNALRAPPIDWREHSGGRLVGLLKQHGLGGVVRAGHVPAGQPLIGRHVRPINCLGVGGIISFADGCGIKRTGRIGYRLIGDRIARTICDQLASDDELRLNGVVRWQDAKNRIIAVHAVHAQVVPPENLVVRRQKGRREPNQQCCPKKSGFHGLIILLPSSYEQRNTDC